MSYPQSSQQPIQPSYPNVQQNHSLEHFQGTKYKEKATIFGVVGLFVLGIVFGPLAISNARKAEALHHSATVGKVLGWIDTICGVIGLFIFVVMIMGATGHH